MEVLRQREEDAIRRQQQATAALEKLRAEREARKQKDWKNTQKSQKPWRLQLFNAQNFYLLKIRLNFFEISNTVLKFQNLI